MDTKKASDECPAPLPLKPKKYSVFIVVIIKCLFAVHNVLVK